MPSLLHHSTMATERTREKCVDLLCTMELLSSTERHGITVSGDQSKGNHQARYPRCTPNPIALDVHNSKK